MSALRDRVGDLTLFEALTGGAFDRLNWQHSGEVDQHFSKKSNAPGFARRGGWAVLELTGTLVPNTFSAPKSYFLVARNNGRCSSTTCYIFSAEIPQMCCN